MWEKTVILMISGVFLDFNDLVFSSLADFTPKCGLLVYIYFFAAYKNLNDGDQRCRLDFFSEIYYKYVQINFFVVMYEDILNLYMCI